MMGRGFWRLLGVVTLVMPWVAFAVDVPLRGVVDKVVDGDTIYLKDGTKVRLLDINTPELAHEGRPADALGREAANYLKKWVLGKEVLLETGPQERDQFGRVLAQVYLAQGGGWMNGTMVRDGFAHVYTFADNAMYPRELLAYEAAARAAGRGIWALPRWSVRAAEVCCVAEDIGRFQLVEGVVKHASRLTKRKDARLYLNFGTNYKTDFSVFISQKDERFFRRAGIADIAAFYVGKRVRVHGHLQPVNGVLVRVTHPAQIEVLE